MKSDRDERRLVGRLAAALVLAVGGRDDVDTDAAPTHSKGDPMSNLNVAGQGRALPMTGFAALPLLVLGAVLSVVGSVMSLLRRRDRAAQPTK